MSKECILDELACLDAYKLLQHGAMETLAALEEGKLDEATQKLRCALSVSHKALCQSIDGYFFGKK